VVLSLFIPNILVPLILLFINVTSNVFILKLSLYFFFNFLFFLMVYPSLLLRNLISAAVSLLIFALVHVDVSVPCIVGIIL
jgi:hypothetical protein